MTVKGWTECVVMWPSGCSAELKKCSVPGWELCVKNKKQETKFGSKILKILKDKSKHEQTGKREK